jgi:hypothetical protein
MIALDTLFVERGILPSLALTCIIIVALAIGLRTIFDVFASRGAELRLTEAQRRAFEVQNSTPVQVLEIGPGSEDAKSLGRGGVGQKALVLNVASLFDLYSKQIDKYQAQTQSRATMSFLCAVASKVAGIALLIWGGWAIVHPLNNQTGDGTLVDSHLLPGSVISVIGGAMSAFITKTFLDIHRTSLLQLNHYFKRPVLNSHILSVQRLSELIWSQDVKEKVYQDLIKEVIALIALEQAQPVDLSSRIKTGGRSDPGRKQNNGNGRGRNVAKSQGTEETKSARS